MRERIRSTIAGEVGCYSGASELLEDLRLVERSLEEGPGVYTAAGDLHDVIRQVEVFGFHFARLDVREHATMHRRALAEVYAALGICQNYEELGEDERFALLVRDIADHRPLIPADIGGFSEATATTIETFRTLRTVLSGPHRGAIQTYVVSGHAVGDRRARGPAVDEGGEPLAGGWGGGVASDRAALRIGRDACGRREDHGAAAARAVLPRRPARRRRRAGGDDRLLRLEQGRRLRRLRLGRLQGADAARRDDQLLRGELGLLPRSRRRRSGAAADRRTARSSRCRPAPSTAG